jgi:hypothetical protein
MWTVVPDIHSEVTALHIQASTFNWTYLRRHRICYDISMRVILQIWCQIQRTASSLRYVNCGPDIYNLFTAPHIQASIFNWTYLRCCWRHLGNSLRVILQTWCQIQHTSVSLRYLNCGPGHTQCYYSSAYPCFNVQLNVGALLFDISRQFNALCTANWEPNAAHILQFTLCELWSRPYIMLLQLCIFRLQYSTERICAAIGDITTIQCVLYCKLGVKYSAHAPVYNMWTVVPDIYNVITVPQIQASILNCPYVRCYSRYLCKSMRFVLETWCQI